MGNLKGGNQTDSKNIYSQKGLEPDGIHIDDSILEQASAIDSMFNDFSLDSDEESESKIESFDEKESNNFDDMSMDEFSDRFLKTMEDEFSTFREVLSKAENRELSDSDSEEEMLPISERELNESTAVGENDSNSIHGETIIEEQKEVSTLYENFDSKEEKLPDSERELNESTAIIENNSNTFDGEAIRLEQEELFEQKQESTRKKDKASKRNKARIIREKRIKKKGVLPDPGQKWTRIPNGGNNLVKTERFYKEQKYTHYAETEKVSKRPPLYLIDIDEANPIKNIDEGLNKPFMEIYPTEEERFEEESFSEGSFLVAPDSSILDENYSNSSNRLGTQENLGEESDIEKQKKVRKKFSLAGLFGKKSKPSLGGISNQETLDDKSTYQGSIVSTSDWSEMEENSVEEPNIENQKKPGKKFSFAGLFRKKSKPSQSISSTEENVSKNHSEEFSQSSSSSSSGMALNYMQAWEKQLIKKKY